MIASQDREALRQVFFDSLQKYQQKKPLSPLEEQVVEIITIHPEYQAILQDKLANLDKDYLPEMGQTNPFLHMSAHIGLREQISTNRPAGIQSIFMQLAKRLDGDTHLAEHQMMDCMMTVLWQSARAQCEPDENVYLRELKKLLC